MIPAAILIAGPTASGKSAVALAIAQRHNGTLINADSMQVYRDLRIINARPTDDEMRAAPHRLFGHVDGATNYSVGEWLREATAAYADVMREGRLPIFVGGTGLYFRALTQGLSDIPAVSDETRARVRASAEGRSPADLHAELAARDPQTAARLRPSDPQRLLRALEVLAETGRGLASFQGSRQPPLLDERACLGVFLAPDRAMLRARIDARFDTMLELGALDEIDELRQRQLDPRLPIMRAHGVPHLLRYLDGAMTRDEAVLQGKLDTKRYAKRQFTFARHQLPGFRWVDPTAAIDVLDARMRDD